MGSQRRSPAEWASIVSDWKKSGQSHAAFASERRLALKTLQSWIYRLRDQKKAAHRFLPIEVIATPTPAVAAPTKHEAHIEIALTSGACIRFGVGTDVHYVAAVVSAVK